MCDSGVLVSNTILMHCVLFELYAFECRDWIDLDRSKSCVVFYPTPGYRHTD